MLCKASPQRNEDFHEGVGEEMERIPSLEISENRIVPINAVIETNNRLDLGHANYYAQVLKNEDFSAIF
jgi:ribosome-binding factor A